MRAKQVARRVLPHSAYRLYRRRKVARLVARYPVRVVEHTYGTQQLTIQLTDPLAEGWYDHDWPEPREIRFLRGRGVLVPGATVFDVGAHQAVVALILAAEVGERGRVIAVEAEPHNARAAVANRDLNRATNLEVVHAAAGSAVGVLMFAEGLNGHVERTTQGNVAVRAVTIDELAFEYGWPDLVYLDVEGFEGEALCGAARVLERRQTSLFVELHETLPDYGYAPDDIVRKLEGFDLYVAPEADDADFAPAPATLPPGRQFLIAMPRADATSRRDRD
jgi:FkbM family methyltransferase